LDARLILHLLPFCTMLRITSAKSRTVNLKQPLSKTGPFKYIRRNTKRYIKHWRLGVYSPCIFMLTSRSAYTALQTLLPTNCNYAELSSLHKVLLMCELSRAF